VLVVAVHGHCETAKYAAITGYFALPAIFWVFCFGMWRYSISTERRFAPGKERRLKSWPTR